LQQLTTENKLNYVHSNKGWLGFVEAMSDNTGDHFREDWFANGKINKELLKKSGWATETFQDTCIGKTAVVIGASPSIAKQLDTLRDLQNDPNFVLLTVSSEIRHLLNNGIKPHFVLISDASPVIKTYWDGMDMELTKGITLVSSPFVPPEMLHSWQGDVKFIAYYTTIKRLDKMFRRDCYPINGCDIMFPSLASSYNSCVSFSYLVLRTEIIIMVGNELSYEKELEGTYYVDREDAKDKGKRYPHINIYGGKSWTTTIFMATKLALEDYLGKLHGWFFNATEAGILGVSSKYGNLPWIKQVKLKMAVAHAKSLMQTGRPLSIAA
jgi:hypothetical protein